VPIRELDRRRNAVILLHGGRRGDWEAKFWLRPEVRLAYADGFSATALRGLLALVEGNRARIEKAWNEFFG
jgi:hypothetical protein